MRLTGADLLHRDLLRAPGVWTTASHRAAQEREGIDTNRKRNIGLAAARMTGRPWVLFVDDDVLRLGTHAVLDAMAHLRSTGRRVAGWPCDWFPDNSVVHHARRDFLGLHQDVFLTGAALLVHLEGWDPPGFPPMYNEDWLFLYEPIARGLVVAGPDIGQATYNPYARPERARDEEFGDVLGEGLFHLLHVREPVEVATEAAYWHSVHAKRTKLIRRIVAGLRERLAVVATESEQARLVHALAAIEESRKQLTRATPASLADFVRRWRLDEQLWRSYLTRLPPRDTLRQALVYLGLHESWIVGLRAVALALARRRDELRGRERARCSAMCRSMSAWSRNQVPGRRRARRPASPPCCARASTPPPPTGSAGCAPISCRCHHGCGAHHCTARTSRSRPPGRRWRNSPASTASPTRSRLGTPASTCRWSTSGSFPAAASSSSRRRRPPLSPPSRRTPTRPWSPPPPGRSTPRPPAAGCRTARSRRSCGRTSSVVPWHCSPGGGGRSGRGSSWW